MLDLNLVLIFMILTALVAIKVRDLFSSVIALAALGLGLCMAFLILKAPDLAIAQLVIEVMCIIILVKATIKKRPAVFYYRKVAVQYYSNHNIYGYISHIYIFLYKRSACLWQAYYENSAAVSDAWDERNRSN